MTESAKLFAIVLAAATLVPFLAEWLKLPAAASLVIAGFLLGPEVLGILPASGSVQFLAGLGLAYICFAAGTETDLAKIFRHPGKIASFSIVSFLVPFFFGTAVGRGLLDMPISGAMLLGAFMASAGPAAYQALEKLGITRHHAVAIAHGSAVLSRSTAIAVFAAVAWISTQLDAHSFDALHLALLALYILGTILVLPVAARLFLRKSRAKPSTEFVFLLFLAYLSAWAASTVGLEPFMGAFLAGLVLGKFVPESSPITERLHFVGESFMMPFFLLQFGLAADFGSLFRSVQAIPVALTVAAFALAAKWMAAEGTGFALGKERAERGILFALSSTYDALSLAFAAAAAVVGHFDMSILSGAFILCVVSGPLANAIAHYSGKGLHAHAADGMRRAFRPLGRILVAISKPETAPGLMELAFLFRESESAEPVYPLAIVNETEDHKKGVARAEDMLASALVQSVNSSIPVLPVTRMAMNVSKGILQAAAEQKADAVIIGWNKPPRLANAFFGSVIEQVVTGDEGMTIVARLPSKPSQVRQLVLVAPPSSEGHPGFASTLLSLQSLAHNLQARTLLITLQGQGAALQEAIAGIGRFAGLHTIELDDWRSMKAVLHATGPGSRMFVLLSARPGEWSWHPAVERLPHLLGETFPDSPLLMMYFPSPHTEESRYVEPEPQQASLLRDAVEKGHVDIDLREAVLADGIRSLAATVFPGKKKMLAALAETMTGIAQKQPVELEPGVILLHSRIPDIQRPELCLGVRRAGYRLSALQEPVRIIVLLCVPEAQSPEQHLAVLGTLACLFRDEDLAKKLLSAQEPRDIV